MTSEIDTTKDWHTRAVTCENGHTVSSDGLAQRQISEAVEELENPPPEDYDEMDHEEGIEFAAQFKGTSDRDAAILACVWFDDILAGFIELFSIGDDRVIEKMVNGAYAPLASFSARINFCYFFGLISEEEYEALIALKRIRIPFAHYKLEKSVSLEEDQSLADHARNLGRHLGLKVDQSTELRSLFNESVRIMYSGLVSKLYLVRRCSKMPFDPYGGVSG